MVNSETATTLTLLFEMGRNYFQRTKSLLFRIPVIPISAKEKEKNFLSVTLFVLSFFFPFR